MSDEMKKLQALLEKAEERNRCLQETLKEINQPCIVQGFKPIRGVTPEEVEAFTNPRKTKRSEDDEIAEFLQKPQKKTSMASALLNSIKPVASMAGGALYSLSGIDSVIQPFKDALDPMAGMGHLFQPDKKTADQSQDPKDPKSLRKTFKRLCDNLTDGSFATDKEWNRNLGKALGTFPDDDIIDEVQAVHRKCYGFPAYIIMEEFRWGYNDRARKMYVAWLRDSLGLVDPEKYIADHSQP